MVGFEALSGSPSSFTRFRSFQNPRSVGEDSPGMVVGLYQKRDTRWQVSNQTAVVGTQR